MLDVLDRYLVREFLMYFIFLWLGLAVLFLGVDFLTNLWNFHWPMEKVIRFYSFKLPFVLQLFFPVASLLATLLVLSSLSKQNEILALFANGVGVLRIASTFIALVAILSSLSFLAFDTLVPLFNKKRIFLERNIDPSQEHTLFSGRMGFWYRSGRLIYNVGNYVAEHKKIEDISVYILNPQFQLIEAIHASYASFNGSDWVLHKGHVLTYPFEENFPVSKAFVTKTGVIPEKPSDFQSMKVIEEVMKLKDMRKYIQRNKSYGLDTTYQQVNYHERIATVFTPLIFVFLSIIFAINPLKTHSIAKSVGYCFLIVVIYLLMFRLATSLGKSGHVPAIVAGWLTNFLFLIYSFFMLTKRWG